VRSIPYELPDSSLTLVEEALQGKIIHGIETSHGRSIPQEIRPPRKNAPAAKHKPSHKENQAAGGETHQIASNSIETLITQQRNIYAPSDRR